MYGHPEKPDPWSSVVDEPALYTKPEPEPDPTGFLVAMLVISLPVFSLAFALGYLSGLWGWI